MDLENWKGLLDFLTHFTAVCMDMVTSTYVEVVWDALVFFEMIL